jgi:acetyltransferase
MGQYNLNRIFRPRHVAVVGASESAGSIGNALMKNLIEGGSGGHCHTHSYGPEYRTGMR